MEQFDVFRINCWLEDLDDGSYESAINSVTFEYLLQNDNREKTREDIFTYITKKLGIKLQFQMFISLTDSNPQLIKESLDDVVMLKLNDETLEKFRERHERNYIDKAINQFCLLNETHKKLEKSIKEILMKGVYININSFVLTDLKTLMSESIRSTFKEEEIAAFNDFLDWENLEKNKAIYSLFAKSIEFALLTSGRGVTAISKDIFKNKIYYLDANVVIRALGIDGEQRKESILSVLESCFHHGVKFRIAKATYNELYGILEKRSQDISQTTSPDAEEILSEIIDDLPFNNSFEIDYLKKRKSGKVSSPNNYRLHIEKELQQFIDRFQLKTEVIKNLQDKSISKMTEKLFQEKRKLKKMAYKKAAALVDAKNVLHIRNIREGNNFNYRDIDSFYLTTDGSLNEIVSIDSKQMVAETILPSQLFILHNSYHQTTKDKDYSDFVKFIKLRRTDFKLKGQEVFDMLNKVREVTSNPQDIKSSLIAYANYSFKNRKSAKGRNKKVLTLQEFTASQLERKIDGLRTSSQNFEQALQNAIKRIPNLYKLAKGVSLTIQLILLSLLTLFVFGITKNSQVTVLICTVVVGFRIILFFMQDKFGFEKYLRNKVFDFLIQQTRFNKVYPQNINYASAIEEFRIKSK